jgi:hypothetical protein
MNLPAGSLGRAPPGKSDDFRLSSFLFEKSIAELLIDPFSLFLIDSGTGAAADSLDSFSIDFVRTVTNFGLVILGESSTIA